MEWAVAAKAVRAFFGQVPSWVWIAMLAALVVAGGYRWHEGAKHALYDKGYAAGRADEKADNAAAVAKEAVRQAAITAPIRKANDEEASRIGATADELLRKGPGKASAGSCHPAVPGRPQPAPDAADVAGGLLSSDDRITDGVVVPWSWLVGRAKECDLDLAEVRAARNQHELLASPASPQPR